MEKNKLHRRTVDLENSFEDIWKSICSKVIELETEDLKTPLVVKARMAKRRGSSNLEAVLVFLKKRWERQIEGVLTLLRS